jgi:hypothetical protein
MVIREDSALAAPDGPALGVLLKGIGSGGALGLLCGFLFMLIPGSLGLHLFGVAFGLGAGLVVGFVCTVVGLALHSLAERFAPALRAPAAATGAAAMVLVSAAALTGPSGDAPTLQEAWPIFLFAAVAGALAAWLTRPLRRSARAAG